jgi:predicted O-methyltransferase YrrM
MKPEGLVRRTIKALPVLRGYFRRKEEHLNHLNAHIAELNAANRELQERLQQLMQEKTGLLYPPGHYYSPVVSMEDVRDREGEIFAVPASIPGIVINDGEQLELLEKLSAYYPELPFPEHKDGRFRYYYENGWYSYTDAIVLYGMIRHLRPKRIIEVGSGFSSCVILDTNEHFFDGGIHCEFIEPELERLRSLLRPGEEERIRLVERKLQDVEVRRFEELQENDILFIDSSHVFKTGSDVNLILGKILPSLQRGVWIHFHDIFYPFEYPREWVFEGRSWNEAYALRSFLQFNETFSIRFFNDYLLQFREEELMSKMPLCRRNRGGALWLRKER